MKLLPTRYAWLDDIDNLPRTIVEARKLYGTLEGEGRNNSPTIMAWEREIEDAGMRVNYGEDSIPWCGLFTAIIALRRTRNINEVVKDPLWARNWVNYGEKATIPCLGDILVFSRGSGGHVAFYVGEDKSFYHVLGGNQSDTVSIMRIEKNRMIAARRPIYKDKPTSVKSYRLAPIGTISKNES